MADDRVGIFGGAFLIKRVPLAGELLVGDGEGFTLTPSFFTWSAGTLTIGENLAVTGTIVASSTVKSSAGGFIFPDNTTQASAATSYSPPTVSTGTIQSNISGGTAAPSANAISAVLDNLFGTTQGSVIYRGASAWAALAPGTVGQALLSGGASANVSWGSGSPWTIVKKTSDQTYTSATLTNDNSLSFPIAANATVQFRGVLSATDVTTTGNWSLNGPASPVKMRFGNENTALNTSYGSTGSNVGILNTAQALPIIGVIQNGANAGTVNLQAAVGSGGTIVIEKGSFLEYTVIA